MDYVNLANSYDLYIDRNENPVDKKQYLDIVYGFMKFQMDMVIAGYKVNLGAGGSLGTICIVGSKVRPRLNKDGEIRGLAPDWRKTIALWKRDEEAKNKKEIVYCFNEHSNSIRYRIIWYRDTIKVINHKIYNLIFTKGPNGNKRKVYNSIKAGKEYIVQVEKQNNNYGRK